MADDLGYSDLGCYGSEIKTPNLDSLAQEGLKYTQFYNTSRCWPTRASLLTGYYAQQIRRDSIPGDAASGINGKRPSWATLLPKRLGPLGYVSYHVGKWHIDGTPLSEGFDHSYYLADQDSYFLPKTIFRDDVPQPVPSSADNFYATSAIADATLAFLKDHQKYHPNKKFFIYTALTAPHFPLQALPEDINLYRNQYSAGWEEVRNNRWNRMLSLGFPSYLLSAVDRNLRPSAETPSALMNIGPNEVNTALAWSGMTKEQQEFQSTKMAIYAAMISRLDYEVGRIIQSLRDTNILDDTLIFFFSDNGASSEILLKGDGHSPQAALGSQGSFLCLGPGWSSVSNTPFRMHKTWVHEGGISSPLIVHWPHGIFNTGQLRHTQGHVIDIVPTILDIVGGAVPNKGVVPRLPGISLVPSFSQDIELKRQYFWWFHENNRALRSKEWKIVSSARHGGDWELYNMQSDRTETKNLAHELPLKVQELSSLWETTLQRFTQDLRK